MSRTSLVAAAGTISQFDRAQGIVYPRVAQTDGVPPLMIELAITKGIVGSVARTDYPVFNPSPD